MRIGRTIVSSLLVFQIMLGYLAMAVPVYAELDTTTDSVQNAPVYSGVQESIAAYLCVPSDNPDGADLFNCITKAYKFGIAFGAIALVFFVVFAGYLYLVGGEKGKQKGKSVFLSALTGMALILSSYVLLNFINPSLIKIRPIQAPIFYAADLPKCEDIGYSQNCILPSGQVSIVSNGGSTVVGGFNIRAYATDPRHEAAISTIYERLKTVDLSSAAAITAYMKKYYPSTPLTGEMVLASSKKYNVDVKMILAMMQQDSSMGTAGKGARTHNPGNVGNDDTGKLVDWGTWEKGVDAVAAWLNKHRG